MKSYEFTEQSSYNYYRIDAACADTVRKLLAQLLETFLDCPDSCALLTFSDEQLYDVARAYRDICVGYRHPRVSSTSFHYRPSDPTLQRLYARFPKMTKNDC